MKPELVPDTAPDPEPVRHTISREAADTLKELAARKARVDADAAQFVVGLAMGLGVKVTDVVGVDDGEEPALLLKAAGAPEAVMS